MVIDIKRFQFGALLGFKMARLEFIWGSDFDFAIREFDRAKQEILLMIRPDNLTPDETDFYTFSSCIINHYMYHDAAIFYSLLIGTCIQRAGLVGASSDADRNAQMEALAFSSLKAVPEEMIGNREAFFSRIRELCADHVEFFTMVQQLCDYINRPEDVAAEGSYQIFISYRREGGEALAGRLADRFTSMGYKVFYDVESMRSGPFNTQLLDAIDECRDVFVVLPPNGLDRCVNEDDWVRQELAHALKQKKNVIPILMRGFDFPETLPEDIDKIRYQEGVEASTAYFDAFIQRLEELVHSKRNKSTPWGKIWL